MDRRTSNIIMICKGKHEFGDISSRDAIKKYMSQECDMEESFYTEGMVNGIIMEALFDYIDSIKDTKPSVFLRKVKSMYDMYNDTRGLPNIDFYDAVLKAFRGVRVKNEYGYVNGFNEGNDCIVRKL